MSSRQLPEGAGGRIASVEIFGTRSEALEAAGLRE